jgi:hypothetical protein
MTTDSFGTDARDRLQRNDRAALAPGVTKTGVYGACRSRTNADDRLPLDPLGRVEGGDGIVEVQAAVGTADLGSVSELLPNGVDEHIPSCGVGNVGSSKVTVEVSF